MERVPVRSGSGVWTGFAQLKELLGNRRGFHRFHGLKRREVRVLWLLIRGIRAIRGGTCVPPAHNRKNSMLIKRIEMRELRMRLLNPFETSFGKTQDRHIVLIKVSDGHHTGWGEVTAAEGPFYSYETWETAWHVLHDYILPA